MPSKSSETYGFNTLFSYTPHDTDLIPGGLCRGFMVGADGNIAVTMGDGNDVTITGVKAGAQYAIQILRVKNTGTTATGILVGR